MKRCKLCCMPDTRPGLTFDAEGVCAACRVYEVRKHVDYAARMEELRALCDQHRDPHHYDCIIAVSGGKDSHYQVQMIKQRLGMHPLLVSVSDNFPMTAAGEHNIRNIQRLGADMLVFRPNPRAQRMAMRHCFERFGKPTYFTDRYIYTIPLWYSVRLGIPLVFYGENVQYEYSGVGPETPSALDQISNGVASGIDSDEIYRVCGERLPDFDPPTDYGGINPQYLSYYDPWDSHMHYLAAQRLGFRDLRDEWDRTCCVEAWNQVDTRAYLVHPWMKYPKFGHAMATDIGSRLVRYGLITRDEAMRLIREKDGALDPLCVRDFCAFAGYDEPEFWLIVNRWYNPDLFVRVGGKWVLRED